MSKSDSDGKATILLTDSDDDIRKKIRKAVTDFTPQVRRILNTLATWTKYVHNMGIKIIYFQVTYDPEQRPGVANLVRLHCLAADKVPEEVVEESDGLTTAQYKVLASQE